jgi:hypothetical protein
MKLTDYLIPCVVTGIIVFCLTTLSVKAGMMLQEKPIPKGVYVDPDNTVCFPFPLQKAGWVQVGLDDRLNAIENRSMGKQLVILAQSLDCYPSIDGITLGPRIMTTKQMWYRWVKRDAFSTASQ